MWQMSTIWADTVDQARAAARDFVFAGLSDKEDLYGLHDCVYNYETVKVMHELFWWHGSCLHRCCGNLFYRFMLITANCESFLDDAVNVLWVLEEFSSGNYVNDFD